MNVVIRTLDTLTLIGESQKGLSLTQISEVLEYPLATAHRILRVLTDQEFIRRDPISLEYFSGRRLNRIASLARRETLASVADVNLKALSESFNETVMITQLIDGRALCVALAESRRPMHLSVSVGQAVPLHAAASARVLYSDLSDDEVSALLESHDFVRLMPGTPSNTTEVLAHLKNIRQYGYDVCDNEFDVDVWAVAAPIRDSTGAVIAGLTLTTPQERSASQQLRHQIIDAVLTTADDIGTAIGAAPSVSGKRTRTTKAR
jgi:DNA-binding IclR family transcriptional regulator